ncbi:MAG: sulfate adenylyltransferase [Patescibacteria group bacterium]
MITAYGSPSLNPLFVQDSEKRQARLAEAKSLPSIVVSSMAAAHIVMLGGGFYNPLTGFMNLADAWEVARYMLTSSGLFWPIPILNQIEDPRSIRGVNRIALRDPNVPGNPIIAIQDVEAIEEMDAKKMPGIVREVYRTDDTDHPGVWAFTHAGSYIVSGPIQVLNFSYFAAENPDMFRTAWQIREDIQDRGWNTVVCYQTSRPMLRAHEELCHMAMDETRANGLLIHVLLNKPRTGDVPADVRDRALRAMVSEYFQSKTAILAGWGYDPFYAGPRETVLQAIFRQNCGCTHMIVGRDHAGVGDYYAAFDAHTIFEDEVPDGVLQIKIFKADQVIWSKKHNRVMMMRDAPDHTPREWWFLSENQIRVMLAGQDPVPEEIVRPEVAKILRDHYQS